MTRAAVIFINMFNCLISLGVLPACSFSLAVRIFDMSL